MSIVSLLIVLILVGALLYVVQLLPIDATIQRIIQVVAIVGVAIYLLRHFLPGVL